MFNLLKLHYCFIYITTQIIFLNCFEKIAKNLKNENLKVRVLHFENFTVS